MADELTLRPEVLPEETYREARRHFSAEELMELLMVVGVFNYFNRFNNALEMPPTAPSPYLSSESAGDR